MNWLLQAAEPLVRKLYHGLPGGASDWSPSWLASAGYTPGRDGDPTPQQSLAESSVYGALAALSAPIAAAPRLVVVEDAGGAVRRVTGTAAAAALADADFAEVEAFLWDSLVSGNGFLALERDGRGAAAALRWLPAHRVTVAVDDSGQHWYQLASDDSAKEGERILAARDVAHLRFRLTGRNRYLGVSPLAVCAPSMALVIAVRKGTATLYQNAAFPSAILTHSKKLDGDEVKRVKARWMEAVSDRNLGSSVVLHNGLQVAPFEVAKALEMQSEELLRMSPLVVSRIFNVPPHMLGHTEGVNYSSAAEASRTFANQTLRPWAIRVGDCLSHALLSREDRAAGMRVRFDLSHMLRGEGQELAEMLSKLANGGIASPNECRAMLGLPPTDGGEVLRSPSNTYPLSNWIDWQPPRPAEPQPAEPLERQITVRLEKMSNDQADTWLQYSPDTDAENPSSDSMTQAELLAELEACGLSLDDLYSNGDISQADWEGLDP